MIGTRGVWRRRTTLLVEFSGPAQRSRERAVCAVKVWTEKGESDWSTPVEWEMGLLRPDDWIARWIEPPEGKIPGPGNPPAWRLLHDFAVASGPVRGRLYAMAHGLYEILLNGERLGDIELAPGYTSYDAILQTQTYDVIDRVRCGANSLKVVLSDGWYRGQVGAFRQSDQHADRVAFLGQMELSFEDGSRQLVTTGGDWAARTAIRRSCPPTTRAAAIDQWNPRLEEGRDDGDFATAYFQHSAQLLGRAARVLGKREAAGKYEPLAAHIAWAWWTEYGRPDGSLRRPTQANYVRALAFGLAPCELRAAVAQGLVAAIGRRTPAWAREPLARACCCRSWPTPAMPGSRTTCFFATPHRLG